MIRPGVRALFRLAIRRNIAEEIRSEIDLHLELRQAELERQGLSPEVARTEALRRFGSLDEAQDTLRRVATTYDRGVRVRERMESVLGDLRQAVRGMRRSPAPIVFMALLLSLAIGANSTLFGVIDRLLLSGPSNVVRPEAVVRLYTQRLNDRHVLRTSSDAGYALYEAVRNDVPALAAVAAYGTSAATLGAGLNARTIVDASVTGTFFSLLGARPALGRFVDARDDDPGAPAPVAVISHALWRRDFAEDPGVTAREVVLNGVSYHIIGVAPPDFTGAELSPIDVWTPMSLRGPAVTQGWRTTWNAQWLSIIGRLNTGATREMAGAQSTAAFRRAYVGKDVPTRTTMIFGSLRSDASGKESTATAVARWLLGIAIAVLIIAVSNVVNLLLARAARRRGEIAMRVALGASRGRLLQLALIEGMLLAVLAAGGGIAVAVFGGQLVRRVFLPEIAWPASPVSTRMLLFTLGISIVTGLAISVVAMFGMLQGETAQAVRATSNRAGDRRLSLVRNSLVIFQTALSVMLLLGAGWFVQSLRNVSRLDLGVEPARVLAVPLSYPGLSSLPTPEAKAVEIVRRHRVYSDLVAATRQVAGVEHAAVAVGMPFGSSFGVMLRVSGRDSIASTAAPGISAVSADYFATVGTRVLRGRGFIESDRAGSERVAVVSDHMVRTLWPQSDPIGACLFVGTDTIPCARVVGVVADAHRQELEEEPSMHYYIPLGQEFGFGGAVLLVRSRSDPLALLEPTKTVALRIDGGLAPLSGGTMQQLIDPQIRPWRLGAAVFGVLAVLALLVATLGLYSLVTFLVAARRHEIGVRLALGATRSRILGLVVGQSTALVAMGLLAGLVAGFLLGPLVEPLLFHTSPRNPEAMAGVTAALLIAAVAAVAVPAARATGVDPTTALRSE